MWLGIDLGMDVDRLFPPWRSHAFNVGNQIGADNAAVRSGRAMKVLVVDDSAMYREGLAASLAAEWGESAVHSAADLASMRMAIDRQVPDVPVESGVGGQSCVTAGGAAGQPGKSGGGDWRP